MIERLDWIGLDGLLYMSNIAPYNKKEKEKRKPIMNQKEPLKKWKLKREKKGKKSNKIKKNKKNQHMSRIP